MKKLITGGCSFTEWPQNVETWPKFLLEQLPDYTHANAALGSSGNGLISRRVIYETTQALKQYDAKDILVGVMWSGPDRHDFYVQHVTDDMTANTKSQNTRLSMTKLYVFLISVCMSSPWAM